MQVDHGGRCHWCLTRGRADPLYYGRCWLGECHQRHGGFECGGKERERECVCVGAPSLHKGSRLQMVFIENLGLYATGWDSSWRYHWRPHATHWFTVGWPDGLSNDDQGAEKSAFRYVHTKKLSIHPVRHIIFFLWSSYFGGCHLKSFVCSHTFGAPQCFLRFDSRLLLYLFYDVLLSAPSSDCMP